MDGLIIIDSSGRPIIQSNFRNHPPSYPLTIVDAYNDAVSKSQIDGGLGSVDPVLYVATTASPAVCCHTAAGGLTFLCPASQDVDPLYVFAFLDKFISILEDYLQELSLPALKEHFDVVYQLLEETLDDGRPLTTEPNTLRDIVLPPSFFNKILAVTGVSGLSNAAPTPFSSPIPWRKAGVRHSKNEIYFDILEAMDVMIARNGTLLSCETWGKIQCSSRLSGIPDLTLSFQNSHAINDPSFHPCIRLQKYAQTSALSFVPPDGNFVLMEYRTSPAVAGASKSATSSIAKNELDFVPFTLKPKIEIGEKGGSFEFTLSARSTNNLRGQTLQEVTTSLYLGDAASSAQCSISYSGGGQGSGGFRDRDKEDRAAGRWAWDPRDKTIRWTIPTLPAIVSSAKWVLKGTFTSDDSIPRPSRSIVTTYKIPNFLLSGLKVDQLRLTSEMYKPYKGVRVTSTATVEWRW